MNDINEKELGWDDEIEKESSFTLLPEGDYDFTVTAFERARHNGSTNLPPCNKAIVSISIESPEGNTTIKHLLFLHTITEGMLSAFFIAINQKKHGEKLKMNWNTVIGSTGRCKVYIDKWVNDKGDEMKSNKIKKFYEPADETPNHPAPAQYTAGNF
jgi:hypothetical protein